MSPESITDATRAEDMLSIVFAAPANRQKRKLYKAMTMLAGACISRGDSQTAADILAFLLCQDDITADTLDRADELFADLAGRICPRVILDAREFAADMDLATMVEYLRDVFQRA